MDAIRQQGTAQQAVQGTAQRRGQGTAQPLITTFRNKSLPIRSRSLPLFIRASLSFSLSMPVPSLSAPARNASMDAIRQQGTAQQAVQGTAQRRGQGTAQPLITNSVESIMVHCSWLRKFRSWNL